MKKKFHKKNLISKKSVVIVAVSLILVLVTATSITTSWIEEVSQVEFSTNNESQQTPLHVGEKVLKSDANMVGDSTESVNLNHYFYKAGDMHLSPCYSDGEKFYFPQAGSNSSFREGTKDDANVNYLSATFKINSIGANTAYWFEKTDDLAYVTFKNGDTASENITLQQYIRCSVTIDGATNVYALNSSGQFKKYASSNPYYTAVTGRRMDQYTYYQEEFNQSTQLPVTATNNAFANQGDGNNLDGNTLYTVNKYVNSTSSGTKIVTVKLWLEYNSAVQSHINSFVNVASVNLNFVSSWAKTRRVYVKDSTVHQAQRTQAKWLSHNGSSDNTAGLFWAIQGQESTLNWKLTRVSTTSVYYYVDIPAVYNNVPAVLSRRSGKTTWAGTSEWDRWETVFPDTFHSETYTVYSTDFGTWETADKVHCIYYINSQKFGTSQFTTVKDYMWDSASVYNASDINGKVVKNANWPGLTMTTKMASGTQNLDVYAFFYNADYDRIIFSDGVSGGANQNKEFQTQDLWLTNNQIDKTFDMATLTWFSTKPGATDWGNGSGKDLPTFSGDNTYLYGNFVTGQRWVKYRFAYGGEFGSTSDDAFNNTNLGNMLSKVYIKSAGDYEFIVYYNGNCYKTHKDNVNLYAGNTITMRRENTTDNDNNYYDKNLYAKSLTKGVYRFYISSMSSDSINISLASGEAHNN